MGLLSKLTGTTPAQPAQEPAVDLAGLLIPYSKPKQQTPEAPQPAQSDRERNLAVLRAIRDNEEHKGNERVSAAALCEKILGEAQSVEPRKEGQCVCNWIDFARLTDDEFAECEGLYNKATVSRQREVSARSTEFERNLEVLRAVRDSDDMSPTERMNAVKQIEKLVLGRDLESDQDVPEGMIKIDLRLLNNAEFLRLDALLEKARERCELHRSET
jgi:hypothetical protein